jgi:cell division protein FtsX
MHETQADEAPGPNTALLSFLVVIAVSLFLGMVALLVSTMPGGRALFYDIFHNKFFHMGQTFQWPPNLASVPPAVTEDFGLVLTIIILTTLHCFKAGYNVNQLRLKHMNNSHIAAAMPNVNLAIKQLNKVGIVAGWCVFPSFSLLSYF